MGAIDLAMRHKGLFAEHNKQQQTQNDSKVLLDLSNYYKGPEVIDRVKARLIEEEQNGET